ncbi:MAG: FkbM family methyltransferase [Verrucomicrobia bacterium]|nr:FkbM family methyltransferase [Verrucomicrobiota bacterium]
MEKLKQALRRVEAAVTPRRNQITFDSHRLSVVRSLWWDDTDQRVFDSEILPYFAVLRRRPQVVVDAGAATGMFSLAVCTRFRGAVLYAFEPSIRQRIILRRNLRFNSFTDRVHVEKYALWNSFAHLDFRTHGAISSLEAVSGLIGQMPFRERVTAISLDQWAAEVALPKLDLVKMDIEGAEIEALQGARETLKRFSPELLVQAYHLRENEQAFERCADVLTRLGYRCEDSGAALLHALPEER